MDRPIIFSAPMIQALMDGRKTQTRRLAWRQAPKGYVCTGVVAHDLDGTRRPVPLASPWRRVQPGDRLWVRETLERANGEAVGYPADGTWLPNTAWQWARGSVPSIHMPRWASRLTLTVTEVRVQRLQEISEADAAAEGCAPRVAPPYDMTAKEDFGQLWQEIHGPGAWDANPEVVALTFSVERKNIDEYPPASAPWSSSTRR